jgi:MYXO-CTERM domain-containing protein
MIKKLAIAAALSAAALSSAQAGVILGAQSAQIISGGPGSGAISSTYDQYGLLSDYESGVTDFDAYIAQNPLHAWDFSVVDAGTTYYYEWFSNFGTSTAAVSYDLGEVYNVQGMALWNEDGNGIGKLNILGSVDGVNWTSLKSNLSPTDHAQGVDYGADVFSWTTTPVRFIKLEGSQCPSSSTWVGCSIGEVAFNATAVPEARSIAMAGLGLAVVGAVAARRRRQQA